MCRRMSAYLSKSTTMNTTTTIYSHATIITVDASRRIIIDGAIVVQGNKIVAIDKTNTILADSIDYRDANILDCTNRIILPGLINTHAHLAQSLLRGLAEEVPLHSWLCDKIWPLETNFGPNDGYVGARLTIAEMLKSGTTCFLEAMLTHRSGFENVAKAVDEMGIRACLGKLVKVEETNASTGMVDPRDRDVASMSLQSALAAHEQYHGTCDDRLHVWIAAGTPRGSPAAAHKAIGDACEQHRMGLTMHCAEAPKDLEIYREHYDCSPAEFCKSTNLIGKGRITVLAHMVNLDLPIDLPILAECGATIAHNPASNCKLASGIAAIPKMLNKGVHVALGTDGAPCNNTYDMFQEMRLASLLQKGLWKDATTMTAEKVLEMATINGAKALGLEAEVGSLEVDKKADFVVMNVDGSHCAPFNPTQLGQGVDPITIVVYSCTGRDVESVVVDGRLLVKDHKLLKQNEGDIVKEAQAVGRRLRECTGVHSGRHLNYV